MSRLPALGSPGLRPSPPGRDVTREEAWSAIEREYVEALGRFGRPALEKAYAKVRDGHTGGFWPAPGKFVQAARCYERPRPAPRDARRAEADRLAKAYVAGFLKSARYRRAKKEGWHADALGYVQSHAHAQAQLITGCPAASFDPHTLMPGESFGSAAEAWAEYRRRAAAIVETSDIAVTLPRRLIGEWRGRRDRVRPGGKSFGVR